MIINDIHSNSATFLKICDNSFLKNMYVFGSALNSEFRGKESDYDFLIEFEDIDPIVKGDAYLKLLIALKDFFKRDIDLVTYASLSNPYFKDSVESTKILIYDGKKRNCYLILKKTIQLSI